MGNHVSFTVTATSPASPAAVHALLRDGATWPTWSPIGSFRLLAPAPDGGEGVGAVRLFTTRGVKSREVLLAVEPDRTLSYSATGDLPIRAHRADVVLTPSGAGTTIAWREDFRAKVPGTAGLLRWFLRRFVQQCADGLARHAAAG